MKVGAAAAMLGASILLSRVLGYVRDAVLASQIGLGSEADAYFAAFQLPGLPAYFLCLIRCEISCVNLSTLMDCSVLNDPAPQLGVIRD